MVFSEVRWHPAGWCHMQGKRAEGDGLCQGDSMRENCRTVHFSGHSSFQSSAKVTVAKRQAKLGERFRLFVVALQMCQQTARSSRHGVITYPF